MIIIGRFASILRHKDVTIVCMRPINHHRCHCHWLTRDAAAKSLPLPLPLATKLLAQIGRLLAVLGCSTEVQADDIFSCICRIYTNRNPGHHPLPDARTEYEDWPLRCLLPLVLHTALFASARAAKPSQVEACERVAQCGGGAGRHFTRPQKRTFLSSARKMKPRRVGACAGRVVKSFHPGTMEQ